MPVLNPRQRTFSAFGLVLKEARDDKLSAMVEERVVTELLVRVPSSRYLNIALELSTMTQ
jgi:hypothetical protein